MGTNGLNGTNGHATAVAGVMLDGGIVDRAYIGWSVGSMWVISYPYSDGTAKPQFDEYRLSDGDLLTAWRIPVSDFKKRFNRLATYEDFDHLSVQSQLYRALQEKGLTRTVQPRNEEVTGSD